MKRMKRKTIYRNVKRVAIAVLALAVLTFLISANWWSFLLAGLAGIFLSALIADQKHMKREYNSPDAVDRCIEKVALENIRRAEQEHSLEAMDLFGELRSAMGDEWVRNLTDKDLNTLNEMYDDFIEDHLNKELQLSKKRVNIREIGDSEQSQLVAHFRGKAELESW